MKPSQLDPQGIPDYFGGIPNYANSPLPLNAGGVYATQTADVVPGTGIRKFVDSMPGLGAANANDLGQFLTVAVPDQSSFPGSDYYIIQLVEYTEKMHKDLPPTTLRGYMQVASNGTTITPPHYLGPTIVSTKDRPVRVKFINKLPTGVGGDLFLPTDTTIMGAGAGPNGGKYTAEPRHAAPPRRQQPVDQRRHPAPVDDARRGEHAVPEGRQRA